MKTATDVQLKRPTPSSATAGSVARGEIIQDIIARDTDPPLYKRAYPTWLNSLTDAELQEYYELVKLEHPPIKPPNADIRRSGSTPETLNQK
jgi:hypothetical protein